MEESLRSILSGSLLFGGMGVYGLAMVPWTMMYDAVKRASPDEETLDWRRHTVWRIPPEAGFIEVYRNLFAESRLPAIWRGMVVLGIISATIGFYMQPTLLSGE